MPYQHKILIVDDDPIARSNLQDLLELEGYELELAENGRQAIEKLRAMTPDIVLLDVMMPGMNGFEVCQQLRNTPSTAEVPIIFLTAFDDRSSRLQGIEVGADDFISKPFDRLELRARIRGITRLNRFRRLLVERTKFERVVEQSETGYLLVSPEDYIIFANPKARLFLNLPNNTNLPIEHTFLAIARQQYNTEPQEAWGNWPERPFPNIPRYLVHPETPTTRDFWLQVDTLDYLPSGSDTAWIISLTDVTARLSSQRDIRQFHALISHKLRTPLGGIITSLEVLNQWGASAEDRDQLLKIAYHSAQRLQHDIEEVTRYMDKTPTATPNNSFPLAQLATVVQDISQNLGIDHIQTQILQNLERQNLGLSTSVVEVILHELLDNAKKFHPRQQPSVEIKIYQHTHPNWVVLQVCDDGIELSLEEISQAWTPYYQGGKFFTGQVKGMGLGLSMVASFVWGSGGECRISNRLDGSGVLVELVLALDTKAQNDG